MKKETFEKRIEDAKNICEEKITKSFDECFKEVEKHVKGCLGPLQNQTGYDGVLISFVIEAVDLNNIFIGDEDSKKIIYRSENGIQKKLSDRKDECFFIQFTEDGFVIVVGAGYDFGIIENYEQLDYEQLNDKPLNVQILKKVNKRCSTRAILIFVKGLRAVENHKNVGPEVPIDGYKNVEEKTKEQNILHCRNGLEMYIGEYLLKVGVPILNKYSHVNYTYSSKTGQQILKNVNEAFEYKNRLSIEIL